MSESIKFPEELIKEEIERVMNELDKSSVLLKRIPKDTDYDGSEFIPIPFEIEAKE